MTRIKFLFTSDEHGRYRQAARMQGIVERERAENPNTVLLSSGDVFQGTPESDLLGGHPSLDVLSKAGYEAVEIGNHDFDNGLDFLKEWVNTADYPVLGANIMDQKTGRRLEGVKPYTIIESGGARVGLIGVVTPDTPVSTRAENVEGIEFADPVETVRELQRDLKEQGVDVVGVLSHLGAEDDEKLASEVDGLGFILGGHTHLAFQEPKKVNGTLVCQPGAFREYLGSLEFTVDAERDTISEVEHELIPLEEGAADPQSELSKSVDAHYKLVEEATSTPVSYNGIKRLAHTHTADGSLDHELADAMKELTGTDLALYNRKMIRGDIEMGRVTAGDLYSALPFPDKLVKFEVDQERLRGLMEHSRSYDDHRSLVHKDLGMLARPNEPIRETFYWDGERYSENPQKLTVVTTEFLAEGGLGYDFGPNRLETLDYGSRSALESRLDRVGGFAEDYIQDTDLIFDDLKRAGRSTASTAAGRSE